MGTAEPHAHHPACGACLHGSLWWVWPRHGPWKLQGARVLGPPHTGAHQGKVVWCAAAVSQGRCFWHCLRDQHLPDQMFKSAPCKSELLVTMETAPGPSHHQHLLH